MQSLLALASVAAVSAADYCFPDKFSATRQGWWDQKVRYSRAKWNYDFNGDRYAYSERYYEAGDRHVRDVIVLARMHEMYEIYDDGNAIKCERRELDQDFDVPEWCIANVTLMNDDDTVGGSMQVQHYEARTFDDRLNTVLNFAFHTTPVTSVPVQFNEWAVWPNGTSHHVTFSYWNYVPGISEQAFEPPQFCPTVSTPVPDHIRAQFSGGRSWHH